jgi:hypothetical protein
MQYRLQVQQLTVLLPVWITERPLSRTCSMGMQQGHTAWNCGMDLQHGHSAGTCSLDMLHGHAAWTCSLNMQHGHAQLACRMNMQHGQTAKNWSTDMQHGHPAWTCSMHLYMYIHVHGQYMDVHGNANVQICTRFCHTLTYINIYMVKFHFVSFCRIFGGKFCRNETKHGLG